MDYLVAYRTPSAQGEAVVTASGIFAAQAEAALSVELLTGHPRENITILQVAEAASGKVLWVHE